MSVIGLHIRQASAPDLPFILDSWLKGYRESPFLKHIPGSVYWAEQRAVCTRLLAGHGAIIASPDGAEDEIAGWLCGHGNSNGDIIIHWCHVKPIYRKAGVAKWLAQTVGYEPDKNIITTHPTELLFKHKFNEQHYKITPNPYMAWRL